MKKYLYCITSFILVILLGACGVDKKTHTISFVANVDIEIEDKVFKDGYILSNEDLPVVEVDGMMFYGWYFDSEFEMEFYPKKIESNLTLYGKYVNPNTIPEIRALNSIKLVESTFLDLPLPQWASGYKVTWESSNPEVMDIDGKYNPVSTDKEVIFTASITDSYGMVHRREFKITIKPFPYETLFNQAVQSVVFDKEITKDIILRTNFGNNIIGEWRSSDESIITNDGKVTRYNEDKTVTLTLKLQIHDKEHTATFEVKVKKNDPEINDPQYFIDFLVNKEFDVNKTIMSLDEIKAYNEVVLNSDGANVVDLSKKEEVVSASQIKTMITKYSNMGKYTVYNNGKAISDSEKNIILANRNLDNIPNSVNVQYAISTTHTSLRAYPTDYYADSKSVDRFQETGFSAGIPMIVYHKSLDGKWYYVRMYNYDGWVKVTDIALCDRETFLNFYNPEKFIVVLKNLLEVENQYIRMGYKLPYKSKTSDGYIVTFPTRDLQGNLVLKDVEIKKSEDVSDGFIPYTYTNLLNQGFKLLGMKYSWGDKEYDGLDCSSTMASIYSCFGFVLGRNTSNQWKTNVYGKSVSPFSLDKMKTYKVGTLIYTSSHVLMYIGDDVDGNPYVLHNTSSINKNKCVIQKLQEYGVGSINYVLVLQN